MAEIKTLEDKYRESLERASSFGIVDFPELPKRLRNALRKGFGVVKKDQLIELLSKIEGRENQEKFLVKYSPNIGFKYAAQVVDVYEKLKK